MSNSQITKTVSALLLLLSSTLTSALSSAATQQTTLNSGWNLFSLTVADSSAFETLRNNGAQRIFQWNSIKQHWSHYDFIRTAGDLSSITPLQSYWVKVEAETSLYFEGTESSSEAALLQSGWNLITISQAETQAALAARLTQTRPSLAIESLFTVNATQSNWETPASDVTLTKGESIWLHMRTTGETDPTDNQNLDDQYPPTLAFDFSNADVIQSLEEVVEEPEVVDGAGRRLARRAAATNLYKVKEDGTTTPALTSQFLAKVMYTVVDPDREYVYVALDPGTWGSNDHLELIAETQCTLFKIKISDNSYHCVQQGLYLQEMDEQYRKMVSGNRKPIQFDSEGNLYIAASSFSVNAQNQITPAQWQPTIYRQQKGSESLTPLTSDLTEVNYFLTLGSGEVVYHATNRTNGNNELYLYQQGQTIPLTANSDWKMDFFFPDDFNSIVWGSWESSGLRFASPRLGGGVEKVTIDTTPFQGQLRRIVTADSGKLYAAVEKTDSNNRPILAIYQVLPYDTTPRAEIPIPTGGWWELVNRTPFQISQGYLYYMDVHDPEDGYGAREVIRKLNLEDGSSELLLTSGRFELYGWKLSARTLFFSGFDYASSQSVNGRINTDAVARGEPESSYLKLNFVESAANATNQINDIELLLARNVETDESTEITATRFTSTDRRTTLGVEFNRTIDRDTTQERVQLYHSDQLIPTLQVWFGRLLHLIPDLDGLFDVRPTTPLQERTPYQLMLGSGITDSAGNLYNSAAMKIISYDTSPDNSVPEATDGTLQMDEDSSAVTGNLSATDRDGDSLSYTLVTQPDKGTLTLTDSASGAYSYTPNANENGSDSFSFKVSDGSVDSNIATVIVTIAAVNDAPIAADGTLAVSEDSSAVTGNLSATDRDGDSLSYTLVTQPDKGTL
ncbi:MAG: cadherin-like domain-containing protein, partial [Gammaproteobacteria bacterium]|nr:cadherin-like domain-containing protein [Gammaproteobacteria bacterium]